MRIFVPTRRWYLSLIAARTRVEEDAPFTARFFFKRADDSVLFAAHDFAGRFLGSRTRELRLEGKKKVRRGNTKSGKTNDHVSFYKKKKSFCKRSANLMVISRQWHGQRSESGWGPYDNGKTKASISALSTSYFNLNVGIDTPFSNLHYFREYCHTWNHQLLKL